MKKKTLFGLIALVAIGILSLFLVYLYRDDIAILSPKGMIALKQRDLMITTTLLMLIVVIPVFVMTAVICWKYRASNKKADYRPEWHYGFLAECVWWGFPLVIVIILSWIAWHSSHELDPFRPIDNNKKPLTIEVVSLRWKWLFIYPEQKIATVNFVQFPEKVPITFKISSDAPMNSFWIPELGGQIYSMPGMETKLHLIADMAGSFYGSSANLSGDGFSGMNFEALATTEEEFEAWVNKIKGSSEPLNLKTYEELAKPSQYNPKAFYVLEKEDLFDWIIMKPMMPEMSQTPLSR